MKKRAMLIVALLAFFASFTDVYATKSDFLSNIKNFKSNKDLNREDITTECIYSDGSLFINSYVDGSQSISRETAQISTNTSSNNDNISEVSILNDSTKSNGSCYSHVTAVVLSKQTRNVDDHGDPIGDLYIVNVASYKFGDSKTTITYGEVGQKKPWYNFFTSDKEYNATAVSDDRTKVYSLVSERIYIENDKVLINATPCYFVKKAEQASGSNSYLTFYLFNNVTLMENNGMITTRSSTLGACPLEEVIYLNDPSQKIDTSKSSPKFFYKTDKFSYTAKADDSHMDKYEVTTPPPPDDDQTGKNACEAIPETVKVLKTVIQVMQLGIPAFVIILTSIDIFRMVVSGDLNEELPKRKKVIIIRLIIMLVFFFLPLIINVLLTAAYNSSDWFKKEIGIKDINCLFK